METVSCPILNSIRFCGGTPITQAASTSRLCNGDSRCCHSSLAPPRNTHCYSFSRKFKKNLLFDRFVPKTLSRNAADADPSQKFAVLLEAEGVLMDVYWLCNRQAFNAAFKKLGLDCANWSKPVYQDLIRKSFGDEERMVILYFNRIGWPTAVATSEKGTFMKKVLLEKKNSLDDLVKSEVSSLTPGAEKFIDDACEKGVPVAILTVYSASGEKVARSIVEKLGTDRLSKIKIIGDNEVKQSLYGQLVFGKGVSSSLDEQLAKELSKAATAEKQRIAEEVASMLKLKVELGTSSNEESFQNIIVALRAGAESADVPIQNCVFITGSEFGVAAADRIGMPCVVLRNSLTWRAEFRSATVVMDEFGGPGLTIQRIRKELFP